MKHGMPRLSRAAIALAVLAVIGIALSLAWMFQAGCAGDLGGAMLGDATLALALERRALLPFCAGICAGAALVAPLSPGTRKQRLANALGFIALGGALCAMLGIQFEAWGVRACFAA